MKETLMKAAAAKVSLTSLLLIFVYFVSIKGDIITVETDGDPPGPNSNMLSTSVVFNKNVKVITDPVTGQISGWSNGTNHTRADSIHVKKNRASLARKLRTASKDSTRRREQKRSSDKAALMREKFANVFGDDKTVLSGFMKHKHRGIIGQEEEEIKRSEKEAEYSDNYGSQDEVGRREQARDTFLPGEDDDEELNLKRRDIYRRLLHKKDANEYFTFDDDWDNYKKQRRSSRNRLYRSPNGIEKDIGIGDIVVKHKVRDVGSDPSGGSSQDLGYDAQAQIPLPQDNNGGGTGGLDPPSRYDSYDPPPASSAGGGTGGLDPPSRHDSYDPPPASSAGGGSGGLDPPSRYESYDPPPASSAGGGSGAAGGSGSGSSGAGAGGGPDKGSGADGTAGGGDGGGPGVGSGASDTAGGGGGGGPHVSSGAGGTAGGGGGSGPSMGSAPSGDESGVDNDPGSPESETDPMGAGGVKDTAAQPEPGAVPYKIPPFQDTPITGGIKSALEDLSSVISSRKIFSKLQRFSDNPKLTVKWGEPKMMTNCWLQKMLAERYEFSPSCNVDDSFTPKQCFLERCWCVDKKGRPTIKDYESRFSYKKIGLKMECAKAASEKHLKAQQIAAEDQEMDASAASDALDASADILVAFDIANA